MAGHRRNITGTNLTEQEGMMPHQNPYLAVDLPMVGDIYTSHEVMENLITLCDEFGSRFAGTPGERQAADFIAACFRSAGLMNAQLEPYLYQGWSRGEATLRIIEPMEREIPCIALPYCPSSELTAELFSAGYGTPDEYESLGSQMGGRVVMAQSDSPAGATRWVHRKEKYDRAVLAGASAFLFVSQHPGVGPETGSLQSDQPAPIPGISVCKEDGEFLLRLMERHPKVKLRLHLTNVHEPRVSWNVIGDLTGNTNSDEALILGCHYDGHDISQGAVDPASGLVVLMEAARVLGKYAADEIGCNIRFIAFGTEEIGLTGAYRYAETHAEELDHIRLMLNLDACGGSSRKGIVLHHWPGLEPMLKQAAEEMAAEMPVGQKVHPYSDHFPFFLAGVPTAHIGDPESTPTSRGFGHTAYDTVDKVQLRDLRAASSTVARVALRLAASTDFPVQRRDPGSVQHLLDTEPNLEGYRVFKELAKRRLEMKAGTT